MKNNIIKRIGTLFTLVIIACSAVFIIPSTDTHATPSSPMGSWSDYISFDWKDLDDSRYSGYGDVEAGTTKENPFLIKTPGELASLDGTWNNVYMKLAPDNGVIDLSAHYWDPVHIRGVGNPYDPAEYLPDGGDAWRDEDALHLDGNGVIIKGLFIDGEESYYDNSLGLFKEIYKAEISNIIFSDSTIDGTFFDRNQMPVSAGILAGYVRNSKISQISSSNFQVNINSPNASVYLYSPEYSDLAIGGLIGESIYNTITRGISVTNGQINVDTKIINNLYSEVNILSNYIGGIIGFQNQGTLHSSYSDVGINFISRESLADFITISYVGGLVGATSGSPYFIQAVCILNSYSRTNITAQSGDMMFTGGLAGMLQDSAVNNYYHGNINATGVDVTTGQLFGIVGDIYDELGSVSHDIDHRYVDLTSDSSEYKILGNYYNPTVTNIPPVGITDQIPWGAPDEGYTDSPNIPETAIKPFQSAEWLLSTLEPGRQEVIALLSRAGIAGLNANVLHWCIFPSINDGYPTFGSSCPIPPLPPDTGANIRSIASIVGFTIVAIGAVMIISKKRNIKDKDKP